MTWFLLRMHSIISTINITRNDRRAIKPWPSRNSLFLFRCSLSVFVCISVRYLRRVSVRCALCALPRSGSSRTRFDAISQMGSACARHSRTHIASREPRLGTHQHASESHERHRSSQMKSKDINRNICDRRRQLNTRRKTHPRPVIHEFVSAHDRSGIQRSCVARIASISVALRTCRFRFVVCMNDLNFYRVFVVRVGDDKR